MTFIPTAPTVNDWQAYSTGLLVPPSAGAFGVANAVTASRAYIVRFLSPANVAITKIAFQTTVAAGSNDNCDVGIFNSTLTTLLGSAGSTAGKLNAVAGVQTCNLTATVQLQIGVVYYAAFACGPIGTSAASLLMTQSAQVLMGATAPNIGQSFQAGAFPLTAPFTVGGLITSCPILALLQ